MNAAYGVLLVASTLAWGGTPSTKGAVQVESVLITLVDQAEVPAQEAGVLAEVAVREGDMVSQGKLLAQVDDVNAQIAKRRAKVEVEIARKEQETDVKVRYAKRTLTTAKTELQRATTSIEKYRKSVTGSEIDQLKLAAEQAVLDVEQAESDLAVAHLTTQLKENELEFATANVQRRRIVAPLAGMVVQLHRRRGEWVQAGESVIRVLRLDRLRAEGFVRAKDVRGELMGRDVIVRVDLPDKPASQFPGKLVFISPEVNPVNGQVRVWAEIENKDLLLRPGLPGSMTVAAAADD